MARFNRGQIVKEFLVVRWAKLRLPGGEIAYPMHTTIAAQKREFLQKSKRVIY